MSTKATNKIFCIGLNKTATVSLHEALELLGFPSLHWGGPETRRLVLRALDEGKPLVTYLDPGLVAFSDIEDITHNFDLADRQYPDSRFILTIRPIDSWLDSRQRHVEYNQSRRALGRYDRRFVEVDRHAWAAEYERHTARVCAYFADRPRDLLVLDITSGDGWEPLCRFLDAPVPGGTFPWKNRSGSWRELSKP